MAEVMPAGRIAHGRSGLTLTWAVAQRARSEGAPSGDACLVRPLGDRALFVVVDGAGSGAAAHEAALRCVGALSRVEGGSLESWFEAGHRALRGTRGAALGVARIDLCDGRLDWAAVGDIDGLIVPAAETAAAGRRTIIQRGGTIGHSYHGIIPRALGTRPGDLILMSSDGVSRAYRHRIAGGTSAETAAEAMLRDFGRAGDDRIALAVRVGSAS